MIENSMKYKQRPINKTKRPKSKQNVFGLFEASLTELRNLQIGCATLLLLTLPGAFYSMSPEGFVFGALILTYFFACIGCYWNVRCCWCFAAIFPLFILVPMTLQISSFIAYLFGLVQISNPEGQLLLVAFNTMFLGIPAGLILLCYVINRAELRALVRKRKYILDPEVSNDDAFSRRDNPYAPPSDD